MRTKALLVLALHGCGPIFIKPNTSNTTRIALHSVDLAAASAGFLVGINELNRPERRDQEVMWAGFAVATLFWLPYWFVSTR